ncbi:MAG: PBS lyase [Peptococcaceae bacterium]|nr:MAG: PBS lyase [Peptococcaceae bacterium]
MSSGLEKAAKNQSSQPNPAAGGAVARPWKSRGRASKTRRVSDNQSPFGRKLTQKPACPFCGTPVEKPKELKTRRPGDMPVGSCSCGAVYAYDATGHNLGSAFIEALVFGCNMDWDLAWGLLPEEDYQGKILENYDCEKNLLVPDGFYEGRRIAGALYFIRLHQDVREVTSQGVQKTLEQAAPVLPESSARANREKIFTKKEVENLVRNYRAEPLLSAAGQNKRIITDLQRLLYSGDELVRLRAAEILGKVSAVIAQKDPGGISKLLQRLFTAVSDTGASNWGAIDAIGEIIANSPEIFAGYIPALEQFLENGALRAKVLRAFGRIAGVRPALIRKSAFRFIPFLRHSEPETRGCAAWLLGHLGASAAKDEMARLRNEEQEIGLYENGKIERKTVGRLASEALEKI